MQNSETEQVGFVFGLVSLFSVQSFFFLLFLFSVFARFLCSFYFWCCVFDFFFLFIFFHFFIASSFSFFFLFCFFCFILSFRSQLNFFQEIDTFKIQEKLIIFWKFVEKINLTEKEIFNYFEGWPIVWTAQGYIVSMNYAKRRQSFGCEEKLKNKKNREEMETGKKDNNDQKRDKISRLFLYEHFVSFPRSFFFQFLYLSLFEKTKIGKNQSNPKKF